MGDFSQPPSGGDIISGKYMGHIPYYSGGSAVGTFIICGNGSPVGTVAADRGTLYIRLDGSGSALWVKEGSGYNTSGWVAK